VLGANTSITIIVPVYNEEKRIEKNIEKLVTYCNEKEWDFELIFVEDGSNDKTCSIVNGFSLSDSRIKLLSLPTRLGKGGSIISAVLSYPTKEYVAYMDADLAAGPSELERLLNNTQDCDVIIGSRILRGDLMSIKRPYYRSILSHLYSRLFRILFRIPILDPQCGLKLFRKDIVKKLFEAIMTPDFAFDTDLIVTAFSQDLKIKEVPINWNHGTDSKVRILREIKSMGIDLLSIWYKFHLLWRQHKITYPQKRGSVYGRILFALLSSNNEIQRRHQEHLNIISLIPKFLFILVPILLTFELSVT
jgi:glycosyltransferase involved in cell wall biosynthesis